MLTWMDSTGFVVVLYAVAGGTALLIGVAERRRGSATDPRLWPMFWFATCGLLLVMAAGRASNISDLLTEFGREQARSEGWYETRRSLQAWVIGGVAAVWAISVAVAIWRVPERRRRYLPTAIAVFTLVCFIGIRLISLHQVDALLYRRDIRGLRIGAAVEIGLLVLIVLLSAWRFPRSSLERTQRDSGLAVDADAGERIVS